LHFILPFVILALVALHIIFLHVHGGNNKFQLFVPQDKIRFFPFYLIKDFYYMVFIFFVYFLFVGFAPNYLLHVDNYVQADPLVTPPHIVPEWYFLIFYAVLRSIPSKVGGILLLLLSIVILFILPFIKNYYSHPQERFFNWINQKFIFGGGTHEVIKDTLSFDYEIFFFWFFFVICVLLGFIGSQPIEAPYLICGRILTLLYFVYFAALIFLNKNIKEDEDFIR
jgi:ubiquinol-cytochrome c reductase cytochrome b subunit